MITYELAKQLKDAGFPQSVSVGDKAYTKYEDKTEHLVLENIPDFSSFPNNCKIPTLTKLIESCGDKFYKLQKDFRDDGFIWIASYWEGDRPEVYGYGSTPEIAVAKLWLELNKK